MPFSLFILIALFTFHLLIDIDLPTTLILAVISVILYFAA